MRVAMLRFFRSVIETKRTLREAFTSYFNSESSSRSRWSYDTLMSFCQIEPIVQAYLRQFYIALCCAVVASAVGAYLHVLLNIGGFLTTVASLVSFIWLLSTTPFEEMKRKRMILLMASALFQGASVGPLIDLAIQIDPRLIFSAFVGTSMAFACFSVAALVERPRACLYLGRLLSSWLSNLVWLHIASTIFWGSNSIALFEFLQLYLGLLVFAGYVILETREMIVRSLFGARDYVNYAMTLFTDLAAIFLRILIIMLKNSVERNEKKKDA